MKTNVKVIISGAGPTGLVMALALSRLGIPFRIVDPKSGPSEQSRAMGIQARTLEFYSILGISDEIVQLGIPVGSVHLVNSGKEKTAFSLSEMGKGLSPYPYLLVLAQDVHERFLVQKLAEAGHEVEWGTRVDGFTQNAGEVTVDLVNQYKNQTMRCDWLIGCDGAHSAVRKGLDIGFPGGTNEGLFYVADVLTNHPSEDVFAAFSQETVSLMFPVRRASGEQRLIGIVPPHLEDRPNIAFEDLQELPETSLGIKVCKVNWFSTYHVSHRVAETFRSGRCFLAGDAGHIHSPVGGQGMNTGIGDAFNLAWKLAAVIKGDATLEILDTYEPERMAFAQKLVSTTDRAFGPLVRRGLWSNFLRTSILPNVLRVLTNAPGLPQMMFRTISQTRITYRDTPFSEGRAGDIRGGDRMPWVEELDNFRPLSEFRWQLHIYGKADVDFSAAAQQNSLKLFEFPYTESAADAGLLRDAAYLLRPDGHIGLALKVQNASVLLAYFNKHSLCHRRAL